MKMKNYLKAYPSQKLHENLHNFSGKAANRKSKKTETRQKYYEVKSKSKSGSKQYIWTETSGAYRRRRGSFIFVY